MPRASQSQKKEPPEETVLEVAGYPVAITHPDKVVFPRIGKTKMDLARYYLEVGEGALRGIWNRPMILKRFPHGAEGEPFFQKRAPAQRPPFVHTHLITFPSGRSAEEVVCRGLASLLWVVNLGCIDLNPWPVRAEDADHPDELRIDLDPTPGAPWEAITAVALEARKVLVEYELDGFPKTSGSRGIHINVRIEPRWTFAQVRRAALALAREIERRLPGVATSAWWKAERPPGSVLVDYNQNARDRTVASAYSVRPTPDARVSTPLSWDEVAIVDPSLFTLDTVPGRFALLGDLTATIDDRAGSLEPLLGLAERDEVEGLGDAPWPPHFPKAEKEPPRVDPRRRRQAPNISRSSKGTASTSWS